MSHIRQAAIGLVAVAIWGVAACGSAEPRPPGLYAFATERELIVMRGTEIVVRVRRRFEPYDPASNAIVWTHSGRHIAVLADGHSPPDETVPDELIAIDVKTERITRVACEGCDDLTSVGKDGVLTRSDGAYRRVDLAPAGGRPSVSSPVPELDGRFVASTDEFLLTQKGEWNGDDYSQRLQLFAADGTSTVSLDNHESNDGLVGAGTDHVEQGGSRLAVAFRPNPGECVAVAPVALYTPAFGSTTPMTETDASRAEPPGFVPGVSGGMEIDDLWWGRDGRLHATISSWTCEPSTQSQRGKISRGLWRLDRNTWVKDRSTPALMVREVGEDARIELLPHTCDEDSEDADERLRCLTGDLMMVAGEDPPVRIADDVITIAAPPAPAAPMT